MATVGRMDRRPFFDALTDGARCALIDRSRVRRYPKGSVVFAEGDDAHDVLIVRSGAVEVVTTALNGREVVLDVLHAGEVLGELSVIDAGPRSATVKTLEPTEVFAIRHQDFHMLLEDHASIGAAILAALAVRLRNADRRQLEFGSNDALGRVCHRIVDLSDRYGKPLPDGSVSIILPFSQTDLANWAGLSREAVVKALRALRSLGWIDSHGSSVTIINEPAIRFRADQ